MAIGGRQGARRLLLQALYQSQVGGQDGQQLTEQFKAAPEFADIDQTYFLAMLSSVLDSTAALDELIQLAPTDQWGNLTPLNTRCSGSG